MTANFTDLEITVLGNLKNILEETEMVALADLIQGDDNPKQMRGAIASLVKKGVIDIDYDYPSNINGTKHYWVTWWDEKALEVV